MGSREGDSLEGCRLQVEINRRKNATKKLVCPKPTTNNAGPAFLPSGFVGLSTPISVSPSLVARQTIWVTTLHFWSRCPPLASLSPATCASICFTYYVCVCACARGFLWQINSLAPDAVECSKLARTLVPQLTDDLTDVTIATSYDAKENPKRSAAGVGWLGSR